MASAKKQKGSTKDRLRASAGEVFAQKAYRDVTIAEICKRAGANIAAVNYHFGDKAHLYVEAWDLAFHRSLKAHPPDGGVSPDATAQERLRGRILSIVRRIADPQSREFEIVQKELANPTGLLVDILRESIEPIQREMGAIIRQLIGDSASDDNIRLCQMSIMAQCLHLLIHKRRHPEPGQPKSPIPMPLDFETDVLADHIVRFSLAGIAQMRRQIDSGELGDNE